MQRADIAALQQGARNANDAISLIQVADGALSIIDEKLIRMKELAEQAATGTYDSTQRLMIESEYQAMASEITRIANATDFNGIHLLDGTLESDKHDGSGLTATGKLKVHFGTGNDSAEDYYYIKIGESTAQAFGLGDASTWEDATTRIAKTFNESLTSKIDELLLSADYSDEVKEQVRVAAQNWDEEFVNNIQNFSNFTSAEDLSKLYAAFKEDEEVSALNTLFQQYINNYDSMSERDSQKLKYALGRAAMRSLASYPDIMTGFGDTTNAYQITSNTEGLIGNVNYSAFTTSDNGSIITYAPGRGSLVFMPPIDYNSITYNATTGANAPIEYPMSFTAPALSGKDSITNVVPGENEGESYTYNLDGTLLAFTDDDGTTLYDGSKIAGYKDENGVATFNNDQYAISYLDANGNRTILKVATPFSSL